MHDLARANYKTLMQSETAKKIWSEQQLLMINALHMFSASYFSGNVKITESARTQGDRGAAAAKGDAPAEARRARSTDLVAPKRPDARPSRSKRSMNAINAYVQSAKAGRRQGAPSAPARSGVLRRQLTLSAIRV